MTQRQEKKPNARRRIVTAATALVAAFLAAGGARAEGHSRAGLKVVVYPLEGVNISESVASASTEVFASALRRQGFDVIDRGQIVLQPVVSQPVAAPAPAPTAPQPVPPPPPPPAPPAPNPVAAPAAAAAPASAPATETPVAQAPAPAPMTKGQVAAALGAAGYVDGKIVRLGSRIRVSINLRDPSGAVIDDRQTEVRTDDELGVALERIAMAFAGNTAVDEALSIDRIRAEERKRASKPRLEANFGAALGVLVGLRETEGGDPADGTVLLGFDARLDIGRVLVGLNAGLGMSDDDGNSDPEAVDPHFFVNILAAYYLSSGSLAPFIGAGVGFFAGNRIGSYDSSDDVYDEYDDSSGDPPLGFDVFPTFGLEFMRHASMRCHLDLRYAFDFAGSGRWGHGPLILLGVDF